VCVCVFLCVCVCVCVCVKPASLGSLVSRVDFVKNDCVFGDYVPAEIETQAHHIAGIFERTGHRIVYSLSPGACVPCKSLCVAKEP
jgi:hypothetical protein